MRDLWALYVSGGFDDRQAGELLGHPVAAVRRWTIRLLGDDRRMNRDWRAALENLAASEPDATVRSQLASSCQRWEPADVLPILGRLVQRTEDLKDAFIPNLLWWALEHQLRRDRAAVVQFCELLRYPASSNGRGTPAGASEPRSCVRRFRGELRRLCTTASGRPGGHADRSNPDRHRERTGGSTAFELSSSARRAPIPDLDRPPARPGIVLIRLNARLGSRPAMEAAARIIPDPHAAAADRIALMELLDSSAVLKMLPY